MAKKTVVIDWLGGGRQELASMVIFKINQFVKFAPVSSQQVRTSLLLVQIELVFDARGVGSNSHDPIWGNCEARRRS